MKRAIFALVATWLVLTGCSDPNANDINGISSNSNGGREPECPQGTYYDWDFGKCYEYQKPSSSSEGSGGDIQSSSSEEQSYTEPSSSSYEKGSEPSSSSDEWQWPSSSSQQWTIASSSSQDLPSSSSGKPSSSSVTVGPDGGLKYFADVTLRMNNTGYPANPAGVLGGVWHDNKWYDWGEVLEIAPAYTKDGDWACRGDITYIKTASGDVIEFASGANDCNPGSGVLICGGAAFTVAKFGNGSIGTVYAKAEEKCKER